MAPIVLCIDDRPQLLELRKAVLEFSGYHVEAVTSGHAAIKTLQAMSVDAVLLECTQQGIDAEAIASQIHRRFPNIPVVPAFSIFRDARADSVVGGCTRDEERTAGRGRACHRKGTRPINIEDRAC